MKEGHARQRPKTTGRKTQDQRRIRRTLQRSNHRCFSTPPDQLAGFVRVPSGMSYRRPAGRPHNRLQRVASPKAARYQVRVSTVVARAADNSQLDG